MRTSNASGPLIFTVLCLACTFGLGTAACASPYFCLESELEWNEALMTGQIQPVMPPEWDDYMIQWNDHWDPTGDPYPDNEFVPSAPLYVYGGGGGGGTDPEDAGLVMYWDAPPDPGKTYSSAWRYEYGLDPNLSNSTITVTVTAPQFDPLTGSQITTVSFGIQDANGRIRAWHWQCGPLPAPIQWNVPTTITINTALTGLNAANPQASGYMNNPGFDITQSVSFIVDENAVWVGGPNPVPSPPPFSLPGMWNYWHNLIVTPGLPEKGDDPIKWDQPPTKNPNSAYPNCYWGWDENSVYGDDNLNYPIVADDWQCEDAVPVTDVHWWGSYHDWTPMVPPGAAEAPDRFHIAIWTDVPAGVDPGQPHSHPGELKQEWIVLRTALNEKYVGCDYHPDFMTFPESCFYYSFLIPRPEWFYQEEPNTIYWISISAIYSTGDVPDHVWGWKTREHNFQDDAVRILDPTAPTLGDWVLDSEPIEDLTGVSWDMAFRLTTESNIKWTQPPVPVDPDDPGDPPMFEGWDEKSLYDFRPIVADDWRCDTDDPVTDIHWWGSFLGWNQPDPPPPLPIAFHLGIWTDVPANPPDEEFSHPGELIWDHYCDYYQWNFAGYDYDPRDTTHLEIFTETCFQFVQYLDEEDWFWQQEYGDPGTIFWLSIAAVYPDGTTVDYPWGWKTREHYFMDDAVRIFDVFDPMGVSAWPPYPGCTWSDGVPIQVPEWPLEGVTWDVAFELTTRKAEDPYNDLGDAPDSTNNWGAVMTAYPAGGPPGTQANFPTVFQDGTGLPPYGPIHLNPQAVAYLGNGVTLEDEADLPPDQDPTTNITPFNDTPDLDLRDDCITPPLMLPHCIPTVFNYTVTIVIPNQPMYVNVWFDWTRDGDWDDTPQCTGGIMAPEWAVQNQVVLFAAPGVYNVTTPAFLPYHRTAQPEPIWMRITIADQPWPPVGPVVVGGEGPSAGYLFGETEDYYFTPATPLDWGDAPDPTYPTDALSNGANHVIVPGMFLGNLIDAEPNGQPHPQALGDDLNNLPDEDGVWGTPCAAGCPCTVTIVASMPGLVSGWVDWGQDGSWAQVEDYVVVDEPVVAGTNTVTFMVPTTALPGQTFARVRYSSVAGLSYVGAAPDGEVEDYFVDVNDPPQEVNKGVAKTLPVGTDVVIRQNVVTANFGTEGWYFEEKEPYGGRFAAIGVIDPESWAIGDLVTCYGQTVLVGCELMIDEYASIYEGDHDPLTPLGQTNKGSGGGQFGNQPGLYDYCDPMAVPRPAYGLNSVALLVKLWGRCTCIVGAAAPTDFYIDDGSNLWDGTICPGGNDPALGVKVRIPPGYVGPQITTGAYYAVTGIMRTTTSPDPPGECVRYLWPRTSWDVQLIPEGP